MSRIMIVLFILNSLLMAQEQKEKSRFRALVITEKQNNKGEDIKGNLSQVLTDDGYEVYDASVLKERLEFLDSEENNEKQKERQGALNSIVMENVRQGASLFFIIKCTQGRVRIKVYNIVGRFYAHVSLGTGSIQEIKDELIPKLNKQIEKYKISNWFSLAFLNYSQEESRQIESLLGKLDPVSTKVQIQIPDLTEVELCYPGGDLIKGNIQERFIELKIPSEVTFKIGPWIVFTRLKQERCTEKYTLTFLNYSEEESSTIIEILENLHANIDKRVAGFIESKLDSAEDITREIEGRLNRLKIPYEVTQVGPWIVFTHLKQESRWWYYTFFILVCLLCFCVYLIRKNTGPVFINNLGRQQLKKFTGPSTLKRPKHVLIPHPGEMHCPGCGQIYTEENWKKREVALVYPVNQDNTSIMQYWCRECLWEWEKKLKPPILNNCYPLARLGGGFKDKQFCAYYLAGRKNNNQLYALQILPLERKDRQKDKQEEWKRMIKRMTRGIHLIKRLPSTSMLVETAGYWHHKANFQSCPTDSAPWLDELMNVVKKGYCCLAMKYYPCLSLKKILQQNQGEKKVDQAFPIMMDLALALQELSTNQVVHRDIKPENILITIEGKLYLTGFAMAKWFTDEPEMKPGAEDFGYTWFGQPNLDGVTISQCAVGTPQYMSPEQVYDCRSVDHRSDQFSGGVVGYELLAGENPFLRNGDAPKKVMEQVCNFTPEELPESCLRDIIKKLISKNKDDRYKNPEALINALQESILATYSI